MSRNPSLIPYFGGKTILLPKLLPLIPPHQTYIEVFGGGAALLFAKQPSPLEVYNDIDDSLVNLFEVVKDDDMFADFCFFVDLTLHSRRTFNTAKKVISDGGGRRLRKVQRAYYFYVLIRQAFSAEIVHPSWSFDVTAPCKVATRWRSAVEYLPQIHARLARVQIENMDFRKLLKVYDHEDAFFYLDPPYIQGTRKSGGYTFEMNLNDHQDLVDILLSLKGKAVLSGYKHEVYEPLVASGWQLHTFSVRSTAIGRTREIMQKSELKKIDKRVEYVWVSPNAVVQPSLF